MKVELINLSGEHKLSVFEVLARDAFRRVNLRTRIIVYTYSLPKGQMFSFRDLSEALGVNIKYVYNAAYGTGSFYREPSMVRKPFKVFIKKRIPGTVKNFYLFNEKHRKELSPYVADFPYPNP